MRWLAVTWSTLLLGSTFAGGQTTGMTSLTASRDHARPLLIFAPKPDDPRLKIQLRQVEEHAAAAQERDLLVLPVPYRAASPTAAQLSPDESEATRRRFGVAPADFVVILLGKDGGEKMRSSKPLSMEQLSETIDAMPMRRGEMRAKTPR